MSEEKKKEERSKYIVEVEPIEFTADAQTMILTSNDLCALANEYFKAAFADYVGCKFELSQNTPTMSLHFSHIKHDEDSDNYYACDIATASKSGNSVIDRTRSYDNLVKNGDRYHLTDDGKDVIQPLLLYRYASRKNLNWGEVVADYIDRSQASYMNPNAVQTLTKVSYIDPNIICAKLFGDKGFSYSVQIRGDLYAVRNNMFSGSQNYVLNILRVDNTNIADTYKKLGIGVMNSDFVRA